MAIAVTESPGIPKTRAGTQAAAREDEFPEHASAIASDDPRP